jgi:hypothetical protein
VELGFSDMPARRRVLLLDQAALREVRRVSPNWRFIHEPDRLDEVFGADKVETCRLRRVETRHRPECESFTRFVNAEHCRD